MKQYIVAILALCLVAVGEAVAQKTITVTGRVLTEGTNEPYLGAHIYILESKELKNHAMNQFKANKNLGREIFWKDALGLPPFNLPYKQGISDAEGKFIMYDVPEGAYLMFLPYSGEPTIQAVEGRVELPDVFIKEGIIPPVVIDGNYPGDIANPIQCGRNLHLNSNVVVEKSFLKDHMRMVITPFYTECSMTNSGALRTDTTFLYPITYYGSQYERSQDRRLGFEIGRDPLHQWHRNIVLDEHNRMKFNTSIVLPDAKKHYTVKAVITYEDFNSVWEKRETFLKHCQDNKPMRFLEVTYEDAMLDPADPFFKVNPDIEKHDAVGNINLTFKVNAAELDPANPNNEVEVKRLQDEMMEIENSAYNTLNSLTIVAKSSPEGGYARNMELARKRVQSATSRITAGFGQYTRNRLRGHVNQDAIVAGWDEVADSLQERGLAAEAEAVRAIVERHAGNHDRQSAEVRRLSCYPLISKEILPKLRAVQYQYTYQTRRALNDNEILQKYSEERDKPDRALTLTRYEYWRLANVLKDSTQLPILYRRYYQFTKRRLQRADELAACNYAAWCIKQGIADTTILEPYIDLRVKGVDLKRVDSREMDVVLNRSAIIKNQALMYMLAEDYTKALALCDRLPKNQERDRLEAFIRCLYCDYDNDKYAKIVSETSLINKAVIAIARKEYHKAGPIVEVLLDETDPRKYYLMAQIKQETTVPDQNTEKEIADLLLKSFQLNEEYVEIARGDAVFLNIKGESKVFDIAEKMYLEWKKKGK